MSERLTVTSTTDDQAAVEEAAQLVEGDALVDRTSEGYEAPHEMVRDGGVTVESSTDSRQAVEEQVGDSLIDLSETHRVLWSLIVLLMVNP